MLDSPKTTSDELQEDRDTLVKILHQMLLIRRFEEKCAEAYSLGKIGGFCHLYIGQEAVGVGAISAIRKDDYVLTSYREHGQAIAKGMSPEAVMAELYGKAGGCSKGKGGSMHMFDKRVSVFLAATQSSADRFRWRPASLSLRSIRARIK